MKKYDVVVIGGGITGTGIIRELSKYNLNVALLERKMDIGVGVTKGNGGVVHSGYDPEPNKLKAKLNVKGALMYPKLSEDLGFAYKNTGSMVIGMSDEDLPYLEKLLKNGKANGVPGIKIIEHNEMKEIEPRVSKDAKYALYAPTAGMVDPFEVAVAFAENAMSNGADILRNQKVQSINKENNLFYIKTQNEEYEAKYIVNAAGIYGDEIAKMTGVEDYNIKARLGEILIIDKSIGFELNTVLFPIPGNHTKGIVVIPTVSGNIIVGSTAVMKDDKEFISNTTEGINELLKGASSLVPEISAKHVIREFVGLRPVEVSSNNDFVIEESKSVKGFINAIGIQSPGVASSPAIAQYVVELLGNSGLDLKEKSDFNPYRKKPIDMSELSIDERDEVIKKDPKFGHVVCRCEFVTEGEIVDAIRSGVGALTVDGVKRRTRSGMGRCQGGFCQHKVLSILSRELGVSKEELLLENEDSQLVYGQLKVRGN